MNDIKVGDTVQLKSGGPIMTVEKIGTNAANDPAIWTTWFDKMEQKRGSFPLAGVEKAV